MSHTLVSLIGFVLFGGFFGIVAFAIRNKNLTLSKFLGAFIYYFSLFGVVFCVLGIISLYVSSVNLNNLLVYTSAVLLPFMFFLMGVGIILYGLLSIITRKTLVRSFWVTGRVEGIKAIYFGILWVFAGTLIILGDFVIMGFAMCGNQGAICYFLSSAEKPFGVLGQLLFYLSKPLKWLVYKSLD